MEITFILMIVVGMLLFVVKYPVGKKRDPSSRYYWNLAGIYVGAIPTLLSPETNTFQETSVGEGL
jgi:hypothetical protein